VQEVACREAWHVNTVGSLRGFLESTSRFSSFSVTRSRCSSPCQLAILQVSSPAFDEVSSSRLLL
jgi:hypothetical protein